MKQAIVEGIQINCHNACPSYNPPAVLVWSFGPYSCRVWQWGPPPDPYLIR